MASKAAEGRPAERESLADRFRRWRIATVADPAFRERANRIWPLRILARRKARELFGIVSGFVRSQILFAALESGLIAHLARGPLTTGEAAARLGMEEGQALRLLGSAEAIGVVERDRRDRWWLADVGAVVAGDPGIAAMIRHHALLYRDLGDPVKLLRDPREPTLTHDLWAYVRGGAAEAPPPKAAEYSALMTASQDMLIAEVLAAWPFARHCRVLDLGGGEGAFLRALGKAHPHLALQLFDLPSVVALSPETDGIERFGGDFFAGPLPVGADCITLLRVVCDHEDEAVLRLFANARQALAPGGTLLVAEPMAGGEREQAMAAAYFGFYFLAMRSGRCRSAEEISALLRRAGFSRISRKSTRAPLAASMVVARL